jgi:P4 family phage/plasmid primase-like protien
MTGMEGFGATDPEDLESDEAPEFSDEDLALRFAAAHVYTMRYVAKWGRWLLWTGKVWATDEKRVAFSLARQVARAAARECIKKTAAKAIASAKTVAAIERLAQADQRLASTTDAWDADPWLLNTPDGVVDLRTGVLRLHSSGDFMTKITRAGPSGECPLFMAFLDKITAGDKEMISYIQRVGGYCLTGDVREEAIFFLYGTGQNGKGVLTSTIDWIMADYCVTANDDVFTDTKQQRHLTEIARLNGARAVLVAEVEKGRRWAEARLKSMTGGGDKLAANYMRQDTFQFLPQFKPLISANSKPKLKSLDKAMRRRMHLIPFLVTILDAERDNKLKDKLKAEAPGILRWFIEGCVEYVRRGKLDPPASVVAATDEYFRSEDGVANWISECCDVGEGRMERSSKLFKSWKGYAEQNRMIVGSTTEFKEDMARLGFEQKR